MKLRLFLAVLLAFLPAFTGCPSADQASKLSRANHRWANAVGQAEQLIWGFYQQKVFDAPTYLELNQILTDVNALGRDFHAKARVYDGSNQAEFVKLSEDVRDLVVKKIEDGTLRIKNENARRQWSAVANNIVSAANIVVHILKTTKPAKV